MQIARKRKYHGVEECLDVKVQQLLERRRSRESSLRYYVWFIKQIEGDWKCQDGRVFNPENNLLIKAVTKLPTSVVYHMLTFVELPNVWGERWQKCR